MTNDFKPPTGLKKLSVSSLLAVKNQAPELEVYVDASACMRGRGRHTWGGIGIVSTLNKAVIDISFKARQGVPTSTHGEIMAILEAAEKCGGKKVIIYTDSYYAVLMIDSVINNNELPEKFRKIYERSELLWQTVRKIADILETHRCLIIRWDAAIQANEFHEMAHQAAYYARTDMLKRLTNY